MFKTLKSYRSWKEGRRPSNSRSRRQAFSRKARFESLEDRSLLSVVSWIGGSGNWSDVNHWAGGVVPGPGDDVTINVDGDISVNINGFVTVNSLFCQERAVITASLDLVADSKIASLTLSGGTLSVYGDLEIIAGFAWQRGTIKGSGSVSVDGTMAIDDPDPQAWAVLWTLDGATLENRGLATWNVPTNNRLMAVRNGAQFNNYGTWGLSANAPAQGWMDDDGTSKFNNYGTVEKTGSGYIGVGQFNNHGAVAVHGGQFVLAGGGLGEGTAESPATYQVDDGGHLIFRGQSVLGVNSLVSGEGKLSVQGVVTAGGKYAVTGKSYLWGNIDFTGTGQIISDPVHPMQLLEVQGTVNLGNNMVTALDVTMKGQFPQLCVNQSLTVTRDFQWQRGTIKGSGSISVDGTMTIDDPDPQAWAVLWTLDGATLENRGLATWNVPANNRLMAVRNGAQFNNYGTWGLSVNATAQGVVDNNGTSRFSNYGTVEKTGSGSMTFYCQFNNEGTVQVRENNLTFCHGYIQAVGTTVLNGGSISSWTPLDIRGGSLIGSGKISGSVLNSALVSPGGVSAESPVGHLQIGSNYSQTSIGDLHIDLTGLSPAAQYDQLHVVGGVVLGGTLNVTVSGFVPTVGQTFTIIENEGTDAISGTFLEGDRVRDTSGKYWFEISYRGVTGTDNDVLLTAVNTPPEATPLLVETDEDAPVAIVLQGTDAENDPLTYLVVSLPTYGSLSGTAPNLTYTPDHSYGGSDTFTYLVNDGKSDSNVATVSITVNKLCLIEGIVWEDLNNDGEINFGEKVIENAELTLTGTDVHGNTIDPPRIVWTDADGSYMFVNLHPSDANGYTITETQPDGFIDGKDIVGTVNDVVTGDNSVNDVISQIVMPNFGSIGENYNFGERPPAGDSVTAGQTATIGFWQNKNGQALLRALNDGLQSVQLGNWLAATLPNMYGDDGGPDGNPNDLTGKSNGDVAGFYRSLFLRTKKEAVKLGLTGPEKMDAQVMAVAFACYVTDQTLAGQTASGYGFLVTEHGVGTSSFNVGNSGAAFGVSDDSAVAILDLLFATNDRSWNGVLYDLDHDGSTDDTVFGLSETLLRTLANDVYSAINESGQI